MNIADTDMEFHIDLNLSLYIRSFIKFHQPVTLVTHFNYGSGFKRATSYRVRILMVCFVVMYYSCFFYNMFRPYEVVIRWITYVVAAMYYFLVNCSKILLKL
jgi:hypothetical protein